MISAEIIADSVNAEGNRITTFALCYPRFILCELLTHRLISRNSASSRAIPVEKMLERIEEQPAKPIHWGKNQRGMQAGEELSGESRGWAEFFWSAAAESASHHARCMLRCGVHKQVVNRLVEPFAHITTIATATEWGNFFNLRCHADAQPEFQELAFSMLEKYVTSTPKEKRWGDWHLPFADKYLAEKLTTEQLLKITTARCARVSYLNFEDNIDHDKDYRLHDDLLSSGHVSPFEHAAFADPEPVGAVSRLYRSNFIGWEQYRKTIPNEHRKSFDPHKLLEQRRTCSGK